MIAACAGLLIFIRFSYTAPIHHKLFKELAISAGLGGIIGYSYPLYYYFNYLNIVDESYQVVKKKFEENPLMVQKLQNLEQSMSVNKNFGLTDYGSNEISDEDDYNAEKESMADLMSTGMTNRAYNKA